MVKALVFTFKSGKVSIITTDDSEAVKNLIAVLEQSTAEQNKFFKLLSTRKEIYYIRPSEIAVLTVNDKEKE